MYEVEAKVPIKKSDISKLRREIMSFAKLRQKKVVSDTNYFYKKGFVLRTRKSKDGDSSGKLTIKIKGFSGKTEVNNEINIPIKSVEKIQMLLKRSGFGICGKKTKESEYYAYKTFKIEINFIHGLGYYLEIENNAKKKSEITKAKKELDMFFNKLGYGIKDYEKRYYLDMLAKKRK